MRDTRGAQVENPVSTAGAIRHRGRPTACTALRPNAKEAARANVADAARRVSAKGADVTVRINRPWRLAVHDLEAAVIPEVSALALPMVDSPEHVREVSADVGELAAEAWDRCQGARLAIAEHGLTFLDRFDQPRVRPEVAIERDSRTAFCRTLRELGLDVAPPPETPRPNRTGGQKW